MILRFFFGSEMEAVISWVSTLIRRDRKLVILVYKIVECVF